MVGCAGSRGESSQPGVTQRNRLYSTDGRVPASSAAIGYEYVRGGWSVTLAALCPEPFAVVTLSRGPLRYQPATPAGNSTAASKPSSWGSTRSSADSSTQQRYGSPTPSRTASVFQTSAVRRGSGSRLARYN